MCKVLDKKRKGRISRLLKHYIEIPVSEILAGIFLCARLLMAL